MKEQLRRLRSNPVGLAAWVLLVCGVYISVFGAGFRAQLGMGERALWTVCALASVLLGHELLHALAARLLCRGKVRIEAGKDPMGIWSLRTVFPGNVGGLRRAVICMLPLLVLTVIPTVIIACVRPVFCLFLIAMLNGVGCYFDLLDVLLLLPDKRG